MESLGRYLPHPSTSYPPPIWYCPEHITLLINANQYLFNRKCHVVDSLIAILLLLSQLELHELARDLKDLGRAIQRGNVKPFVFIKFKIRQRLPIEGEIRRE